MIEEADYEVIVAYTCRDGDEGATIRLDFESATPGHVTATVDEPFDPPLYDKSKERVTKSHYFVKDFRPLSVGTIRLTPGRGLLRLSADRVIGDFVIDVHSIRLLRR